MSSIRFIDNRFYSEHGLAAYEFVGACDGLITDYSSVLFDYLLLDKPIGLTWQDVEAYKKVPGVVLDMECLRPCCGSRPFRSDPGTGRRKCRRGSRALCHTSNTPLSRSAPARTHTPPSEA